MIEVEHLTKDYGTVRAVRDLSFEVEAGAVVGFLGPNGAGKSTTLRILAGFLGATSGRVRIAGHDVVEDRLEAMQRIGYMPETSPLYPEMRVAEYLRFRAELKRVGRRARSAEVERVLGEAHVEEMADTLIGHLSKGYRQRVGLADALLGSPPLLILDEPSAGLDPNQIREVRALVKRLAEKHTVLLSTHILSEVEATCDRAIVIDRGRLVAAGTIEELRHKQSSEEVVVVVRGEGDPKEVLEALEGVAEVRREDAPEGLMRRVVRFAADRDPGTGAEAMVAALVEAGFSIRQVAPVAASLEQVFSRLTGGEEDR
ncbi:MAG: ABC transporter ATP-binding protein [Polyangiaceae bacterium]